MTGIFDNSQKNKPMRINVNKLQIYITDIKDVLNFTYT